MAVDGCFDATYFMSLIWQLNFNMVQKIIHIDMDAFYASVEQRDNPAWRGLPVVVGGDPNGRGVVATASYEARQFGVRSAMSCYRARQLCPQAVFVRPRFELYRSISQQIRALMQAYSDCIEPLSLDEAYLDVSASPFEQGSATRIANRLRSDIWAQTGLTASAGVSYNKMLAKIASDINKPNGIAVITPEQALDFIAALPVKKFHGIGKATVKTLHEMGIYTGLDLRNTPSAVLKQRFGKRGEFYHQISHGIDPRAVKGERVHKSVGSESTFAHNLTDKSLILQALNQENTKAFAQLTRKHKLAHTVTIKVKYSDFSQLTRSHSFSAPVTSAQMVESWLAWLYEQTPQSLPVRLVGVTYSNLVNPDDCDQLALFGD